MGGWKTNIHFNVHRIPFNVVQWIINWINNWWKVLFEFWHNKLLLFANDFGRIHYSWPYNKKLTLRWSTRIKNEMEEKKMVRNESELLNWYWRPTCLKLVINRRLIYSRVSRIDSLVWVFVMNNENKDIHWTIAHSKTKHFISFTESHSSFHSTVDMYFEFWFISSLSTIII